jgi:uncharacterized protein YndB with AHSA1/START domain
MTAHPNALPLDGITIVREFDAPVEQLFDAWATEQRFASWFGTEHDGRDAARELVSMERPRSLVVTLGTAPARLSVNVLLEDLDGRTRMTFHAAGGATSAGALERARAEWQERFDLLDRLLREAPLD